MFPANVHPVAALIADEERRRADEARRLADSSDDARVGGSSMTRRLVARLSRRPGRPAAEAVRSAAIQPRSVERPTG